MTAVKTLLVKFDADTSAGKKGIQEINKETEHSKSLFSGAKGAFLGFVGAQVAIGGVKMAWSALSGTVGDMISAGEQANQVNAQTIAGLKSTHDASGMTADSIAKLATHLSNLSGIDDTTVQSSENMLLTFTKIGKDVFPGATQAVADLSAKMAQGAVPSAEQMQTASIELGKALQDPVKGVTALQRIGITMNAQEQKQIATMMKHNDVAGAQKVILKELNTEVGGSAAALGKANGGLGVFHAKMDNLKQQVGQAVIPIMAKLIDKIQPLIDQFSKWLPGALDKTDGFLLNDALPAMDKLGLGIQKTTDFLREHKVVIIAVGGVIGTLLVASFISWAVAAGAAAAATIAATWPVLAIAAGVGLLGAGIYELKTHWVDITAFLGGKFGPIINGVKEDFTAVKNAVQGVIDKVGQLLATLGHVKDAVGGALGGLLSKIPHFASGTDDAPGGMAWVGEHGKELMFVPKGAQVIPHDESMKLNQSAANAARSVAQAAYAGSGSAAPARSPVPAHITFVIGSHEIAEATVDDVAALMGQRLRQMGMRF